LIVAKVITSEPTARAVPYRTVPRMTVMQGVVVEAVNLIRDWS
jgi:hypothetical protein